MVGSGLSHRGAVYYVITKVFNFKKKVYIYIIDGRGTTHKHTTQLLPIGKTSLCSLIVRHYFAVMDQP